jgi:hypothetical protein
MKHIRQLYLHVSRHVFLPLLIIHLLFESTRTSHLCILKSSDSLMRYRFFAVTVFQDLNMYHV